MLASKRLQKVNVNFPIKKFFSHFLLSNVWYWNQKCWRFSMKIMIFFIVNLRVVMKLIFSIIIAVNQQGLYPQYNRIYFQFIAGIEWFENNGYSIISGHSSRWFKYFVMDRTHNSGKSFIELDSTWQVNHIQFTRNFVFLVLGQKTKVMNIQSMRL